MIDRNFGNILEEKEKNTAVLYVLYVVLLIHLTLTNIECMKHQTETNNRRNEYEK